MSLEESIQAFAEKGSRVDQKPRLREEFLSFFKDTEFRIEEDPLIKEDIAFAGGDLRFRVIVPPAYASQSGKYVLEQLATIVRKKWEITQDVDSIHVKSGIHHVELYPVREKPNLPVQKIGSSGDWESILSNEYAKKYQELDEQTNGKLTIVCKFLDGWKEGKRGLNIASTAIKRMVYDALSKREPDISLSDAVLASIWELKKQLVKGVKQSSAYTDKYKLSKAELITWQKIIDRDYEKLNVADVSFWKQVIGPDLS